MECEPAVSEATVQEKTPVLSLFVCGLHEMGLPLSVKVGTDVRPGFPPLGVTVAVNTTDWLTVEGLVPDVSVVEVAVLTFCVSTDELLRL